MGKELTSDSKEYLFVFDPMNNRYYRSVCGKTPGEPYVMPVFFRTNSFGIYPCSEKGFYFGKTETASEGLNDPSAHETLRKSIELSIEGSLSGNDAVGRGREALISLVPDTMDEYGNTARSALNYRGRSLFLLPKSILSVYNENLRAEDKYGKWLCLDYDGDVLSAEQIGMVKRKNEYIPARIGSVDLSGQHPAYRDLANEYIRRYEKKHSLKLENSAKEKILKNKMLDEIFRNINSYVLVQNGNKRVKIEYDAQIFSETDKILKSDIDKIKSEYSGQYGKILVVSSFADKIFGTRTISDLSDGMIRIQEKIRSGSPVWLEYIPELNLEYINDGLYDTFPLISTGQNQEITGGIVSEKKHTHSATSQYQEENQQ